MRSPEDDGARLQRRVGAEYREAPGRAAERLNELRVVRRRARRAAHRRDARPHRPTRPAVRETEPAHQAGKAVRLLLAVWEHRHSVQRPVLRAQRSRRA